MKRKRKRRAYGVCAGRRYWIYQKQFGKKNQKQANWITKIRNTQKQSFSNVLSKGVSENSQERTCVRDSFW